MTEATAMIRRTKTAPPDAEKTNQVFNWILNGGSDHDITQAIEQTWPGEAAKPLIVAAMKRIERAGEPDKKIVRGWCIESARAVYSKAIEANDFPAALQAIKVISSLTDRK